MDKLKDMANKVGGGGSGGASNAGGNQDYGDKGKSVTQSPLMLIL